jgi:hypothetical protein
MCVTVEPLACVALVVASAPRTTVHVVVDWPPVTSMISAFAPVVTSATRTRNGPLLAQPGATAATVIVVAVVVVTAEASVVWNDWCNRSYESAIRSTRSRCGTCYRPPARPAPPRRPVG